MQNTDNLIRSGNALLEGVIVIDMTQMMAGPCASQILGDLGATVIKVENVEGDTTRKTPPHFHQGDSAYYLSLNRNKKSISVDLKKPEGKRIFLDLVKKADVVLENNRPGVMKRLGLSYEELQAANPAIVMCSISGFGQDGEWSGRPAYDMIVQALSGGMSVTGEENGRAVRSGIPLGDLCAGFFGVMGLLAALYRRSVTGKGERIDVSMLDVQVSMLTYVGVYYLFSGMVPGPQGRGHMSYPTYRSFVAKDGKDVLICANREPMWQSLCKTLGLDGLLEAPEYALNSDRNKHRDTLIPILEEAFLRKTRDEWIALLMEGNIPCAPVNSVAEALEMKQILDRDMVLELEDEEKGSFKVLGNPIKCLNHNEAFADYPPQLGGDTAAVLRYLGYDDDQIRELLRAEVVKAPR